MNVDVIRHFVRELQLQFIVSNIHINIHCLWAQTTKHTTIQY